MNKPDDLKTHEAYYRCTEYYDGSRCLRVQPYGEDEIGIESPIVFDWLEEAIAWCKEHKTYDSGRHD